MPITVNISPITSPSTTAWTLRHRVKGTTTWITSGTTPANPQLTTNSSVTINTATNNTIYEYQILANCGSNTSQTAIFTAIDRGCPTLLSQGVSVTDSSISLNFPLNTPTPISNHITNILVELKQGLTLIQSQTLTPNSTNNVIFTGLNQNTTYSITYTTTYAFSDNPVYSSYPVGITSNTNVCSLNVTTDVTPTCQTIVIVSVQES